MNFKPLYLVILFFITNALIAETDSQAHDAQGELVAWPEFVFEKGGFAIKMPAEPKLQKQAIQTEAGVVHMYNYTSELARNAFMVSVTELPHAIENESIPQTLDRARDAANAQYGGQVISEKNIAFEGHNGRDVVLTIPETVLPGAVEATMRMLITDRRFFQVILMAPRATYSTEEIAMFLDSLQILDMPSNPPGGQTQ